MTAASPLIHPDLLALKSRLEQDWPERIRQLLESGVPTMVVGTLATADPILKDLYEGPIREQLNYITYMLDKVERDSEHVDMSGRRVIIPVEATGNESPQSHGDGGTLANPQVDTEQDAIAAIRQHNGAMELTDALIRTATGNNAGAFVSAIDRKSTKLAAAMRKNMNRQVFGLGDGVLATILADPGGNDFTVETTTGTKQGTQYLRVNMVVDIRNKTTGAAGANSTSATITAINRSTGVVTTDKAVTVAAGEGVYKEGSRNFESDGLRNITATSRILHSINSATAGNEFWNGNQQDAQNGIAGENLFEDLADQAGSNGQGDMEVFLTTRGVRKRLARTFYSQRRYNDAQAVQLEGGYSAIHVHASNSRIPVISDDDVPKGWAFGLRADAFVWGQIDEPGWMRDPKTDMIHWELKEDNSTGRRQAAWQCWYIWYACLVCVAPNRTGRIINCQDDPA